MKRLVMMLAMVAACGEPLREDDGRAPVDAGTPADEACVNLEAGLGAVDHPEAFEGSDWSNPPTPDWWRQMSHEVGIFDAKHCLVHRDACTADELETVNSVAECFAGVGSRPRGMVGIDAWRESVFACFSPLSRDTRQVSWCCFDSLMFLGLDPDCRPAAAP